MIDTCMWLKLVSYRIHLASLPFFLGGGGGLGDGDEKAILVYPYL